MHRRTFIKGAATGLAGTIWGTGSGLALGTRPRVVLARHPQVFKGEGSLNQNIVQVMLDEALTGLTGWKSAQTAWHSLFGPQDVVGLKVNCINGAHTAYNLQLVYAVVENLIRTGVEENNIIVFDRSNRDLEQGGFTINTSGQGIRCFSSAQAGFEELPVILDGVKVRLSKLATRVCTALVNMPIIRAHGGAGFSGALKNYMGAVDQPRLLHPGNVYRCADLYATLAGKTRLIIGDCLKPVYQDTAGDISPYQWKYNGLLVGTDPVALDTQAVGVLQDIRNRVKPPRWPLALPIRQLQRGSSLGLGEADIKKIELVTVPSTAG